MVKLLVCKQLAYPVPLAFNATVLSIPFEACARRRLDKVATHRRHRDVNAYAADNKNKPRGPEIEILKVS